jgi:hypothetical protein
METIKVWQGVQRTVRGVDVSNFEEVVFTGERIGYWEDVDQWGTRGNTFYIFRTDEGTVVIHEVKWSRWQNEDTRAAVYEFADLNEAACDGWQYVLENAGVILRPVMSLTEWRKRS